MSVQSLLARVQQLRAELDHWQQELEAAQPGAPSVDGVRARLTAVLSAEVGELSAAELAEVVERALGAEAVEPEPVTPVAVDTVSGVAQEAELFAAWADEDDDDDEGHDALEVLEALEEPEPVELVPEEPEPVELVPEEPEPVEPVPEEPEPVDLLPEEPDEPDEPEAPLPPEPTPALSAEEVDGPVGQDELDMLVAELELEPEGSLEAFDDADAFAALMAEVEAAPDPDPVDEPDSLEAAFSPDDAQEAALSIEIDADDMEAVLAAAEEEQLAEMTGQPSSLSEALAVALESGTPAPEAPPGSDELDPFEALASAAVAEDAQDDDLSDMFARLEQAESELDREPVAFAEVAEEDPWAELEAQLDASVEAAVPAAPPAPSFEAARTGQRLPEMDELDSLSPGLLEAVRLDLQAPGDLGLEPIPGYDGAPSVPPGGMAPPEDEFAPSVGAAALLARGHTDPYDAMLDELDPPSLVPSESRLAPARFAALGADGSVEHDPWASLDIEDLRDGGVPRPLPRRAPQVDVLMPSQPAEIDRQPRAQLAVKVGMEHGNSFFTGFSGNVSSGGLFVATHQLLDIGSQLELFFEMPDGHEVGVVGEVRWRREYNADATDQPPGMGVRFLNLGYDDQILIDRYIGNHETIFYE